MDFRLMRDLGTPKSTPGRLYLDQDAAPIFMGYTLEDVVRPAGVKVAGKTAIPAGKYRVRLTMSNRFNRILPLLIDVPMFSGIRIHGGNTSENTEGCLLVGRVRYDSDRIGQCAECVDRIIQVIKAAEVRREPVFITIEDHGS